MSWSGSVRGIDPTAVYLPSLLYQSNRSARGNASTAAAIAASRRSCAIRLLRTSHRQTRNATRAAPVIRPAGSAKTSKTRTRRNNGIRKTKIRSISIDPNAPATALIWHPKSRLFAAADSSGHWRPLSIPAKARVHSGDREDQRHDAEHQQCKQRDDNDKESDHWLRSLMCARCVHDEKRPAIKRGDFLSKSLELFGERGGTRTLDPMIKSHVLYRLSYALTFRLGMASTGNRHRSRHARGGTAVFPRGMLQTALCRGWARAGQ